MSPTGPKGPPVRQALVLAAGNGDRFASRMRRSKLLEPVFGEPLIARTLRTAVEAGILSLHVVLGYQADSLQRAILQHTPARASIEFSFNPDWQLENGVSVLAARGALSGHFGLLMGDHLFEPAVLSRLLRTPLENAECALAVDSRPAPAHVVAEATRVQVSSARIVAIGKGLEPFDALDTGLFVCAPSLFDALERSRADGDTTLSGGIRRLAAAGLVRAVDAGDADWFDIDTTADLEEAEGRLGMPLERL